MHVKVAYCLLDNRGFALKTPEKLFGVTISSTTQRSTSGPHFDRPIVKIESRSGGGAYLYDAIMEFESDSIKVRGNTTFNWTKEAGNFPEGVSGPVMRVAQEWILRTNPYSDEVRDYDDFLRREHAKQGGHHLAQELSQKAELLIKEACHLWEEAAPMEKDAAKEAKDDSRTKRILTASYKAMQYKAETLGKLFRGK